VAAWCGRFDDINDTHEFLEMTIEWYNTWTIVEANVSLFIQHMIAKRKMKYLVPKDQIVFLKELNANKAAHNEYGWKNTGTFFKDHLLNYLIEFMKEQIRKEYDKDGNLTKSVYGIIRIKDPMVIKEAMAYRDGVNVDRLVSLVALVAFARMQLANLGYRKIVEHDAKRPSSTKNPYIISSTPFRHLGRASSDTLDIYKVNRNPFKNLR
jgi:hypothetical protein